MKILMQSPQAGRVAVPMLLWFMGLPGGLAILLWFFLFPRSCLTKLTPSIVDLLEFAKRQCKPPRPDGQFFCATPPP